MNRIIIRREYGVSGRPTDRILLCAAVGAEAKI